MRVLIASLVKEFRLLIRDRLGLAAMFLMPVILAVVITSVQNSTFDLVNNNKIELLLCNKDSGAASKDFIASIKALRMFNIIDTRNTISASDISKQMKEKDAMIALIIPENFSVQLNNKVKSISANALIRFGLDADSVNGDAAISSPDLIFHPVLQQSYCQSISGALQTVLMMMENKMMIQSLYASINDKETPVDFEKEMATAKINFNESYATINGSRIIPNATQHNIPAWTVFAMFFTVISLGSNLVKEKLSGSFIRLKTLPSNYFTGLAAKQLVFMMVVIVQVVVIFSLGVWMFPKINLPALNIPEHIFSLVAVTLLCGGCAISYALCIGVFARTQEQCNGFGAVSVVLFAAIGGVFVPSFAMPQSFQMIMNLSPLHWCVESYYGVFLQRANLKDMAGTILPLAFSIVILQLLAWSGLKRKNLV